MKRYNLSFLTLPVVVAALITLLLSADVQAQGGRGNWTDFDTHLYRFNGVNWQHLAQFNDSIREMLVFGGELVIAGMFDSVDSEPRHFITSWDGILGAAHHVNNRLIAPSLFFRPSSYLSYPEYPLLSAHQTFSGSQNTS